MRFAICATIKNPFNSFLFHCLLTSLLASLLKESAVPSLLEKSSKRVQLFTYLLEESSVAYFLA
jgi:hypothetical protein